MLMTGRLMTVAEAGSWGLVNRVTASGGVLVDAMGLAVKVAAGAPLAFRVIKEVTAAAGTTSVENGFDLSRSGQLTGYQTMLDSQDALEGSKAFAERRDPIWLGR